jgi:fumarate reductase subunit C
MLAWILFWGDSNLYMCTVFPTFQRFLLSTSSWVNTRIEYKICHDHFVFPTNPLILIINLIMLRKIWKSFSIRTNPLILIINLIMLRKKWKSFSIRTNPLILIINLIMLEKYGRVLAFEQIR